MLPVTGFPRYGGMETRNAQATIGTRFEHEQLIHHNHTFTGVVSAVIPSKRAFWNGSSPLREVDVLGTVVVEVVVHVRFGEVLDESKSSGRR